MTTNRILLLFAGSRDERLLHTSITEEKNDGASNVGATPWPFDAEGHAEFDEWFENYNKATEPPVEIGKRLYDLLFHAKFKPSLEEILSSAVSSDQAVIKIRVIDDPLLSRIPFEILHNGHSFLLGSNRTFVRYVTDKMDVVPLTGNLHRYLIILAEPGDCPIWGRDDFAASIQKLLEDRKVDFQLIAHASQKQVISALRQSASGPRRFDAVFVVAHGSPAQTHQDGCLLLERDGGQSEEFTGSSFAAALAGHQGCFVFLCSCWSGNVVPSNPAASVAHHLMYNSPAGSVLAMQRPVSVEFGVSMLSSLIDGLHQNKTIYEAFRESMIPHLSTREHGVPCLYSRPIPSADDNYPVADSEFQKEYTLIESVLSIETGKSRFALVYPGFIMGLKPEDYEKARQQSKLRIPKEPFKYKGLTTAKADLGASKGIIALLGKVFSVDEIDDRVIIDTDDNFKALLEDSSITHFVLFGSRSHAASRTLLAQYSQDFEFDYSDKYWSLTDKRTNRRYSVPDPSRAKSMPAGSMDYAIIEKLIDNESGRTYFVIAGMRDTSTLAAGKYLSANIGELYRRFGNGGFQLLLSIPAEGQVAQDIIEARRPQRK